MAAMIGSGIILRWYLWTSHCAAVLNTPGVYLKGYGFKHWPRG